MGGRSATIPTDGLGKPSCLVASKGGVDFLWALTVAGSAIRVDVMVKIFSFQPSLTTGRLGAVGYILKQGGRMIVSAKHNYGHMIVHLLMVTIYL